MAGRRSVTFDFLMGRNSVSAGTKKVAHDLDALEDHADRSGHNAGKRFREGFGDGVDEKNGGFLKNLITPNENMFQGLKAPLAKALSTPVGLALAASLTTILSNAIPAAVTAGLGVALVGLGAFALRGSTILKTHFKAAGNVISESLRQAAQPLKGPFLQAIETVTGAMMQLQPLFRGLFKGLKPAIAPFVDGIAGLVRNALPGLQAALPGINAAFQQMGARLPGLGKTVGDFFAAISENLPAIRRGIDLLFTLTEVLINVGGAFLTLAQKASNGLSTVTGWWGKLEGLLPGVDKGQKNVSLSSEQLANDQGHLAIMAQKVAARHAEIGEKLKTVRAAFVQERAAVASVIPMFEGYSAKSGITKDKIMSNLRQEVGAYKTWAKDAQTLIKRGADPELVRQLSLKGPEYVHAFVNASGKELAQMSGLMKSRLQAAGAVAKVQGRIMGVAIGEAIEAAIERAFHPTLSVPSVRSPAAGIRGGKSVHSAVGATGGVVTRPTLSLIGERGPEAVVPLNRTPGSRPLGVGGAVTINVYGVTDARAVALKVRDELVRHQGRNGSTGLR